MSTTSPFPAFMRRMTPDKFKTLSTPEQIAYYKKADAWMAQFDAEIETHNAAEHKQLVMGIAQLIAQDRSVEWEIIHNYLRREQKYLVDRAFFETYPLVDSLNATYELKKFEHARAAKQSKKAVTTETGKSGEGKARGKRSAADRQVSHESKAQKK